MSSSIGVHLDALHYIICLCTYIVYPHTNCEATIDMRLTSHQKTRGRERERERECERDHEKNKMADERTPLVATVRTAPPRQRYPHHTLRRFCTIALTCSLLALFTVFLFTFGLSGPLNGGHDDDHHDRDHPSHWSWPDNCKDRKLSYDALKEILLETPSSQKAEEWQRYYTAGAHLAGQNYSQALWTKDKWEEWGIASSIVDYDIYLNRPVDHSLTVLHTAGSQDTSQWKVAFQASLAEDVLDEDPTTGFDTSIPTFHGYSASGNATGPFVYVNYGTYQDYEDLVHAGIDLHGKIAIARYGGIFRGLKVKRAQELGAVGVVLYTDPGDDGDVTEERGVAPYPHGPARQPSSVQRGSTQFLSFAPGDPTTPGYPSKPGVPRGPTEPYIPSIPSLPISYEDALPILKALNGHGPKATDFNKYWQADLGLGYKGVEYNIGPSPDDVVINLYNEQDYIITPNWDVIGIINGSIPDEVVVIGNHREYVFYFIVNPHFHSVCLSHQNMLCLFFVFLFVLTSSFVIVPGLSEGQATPTVGPPSSTKSFAASARPSNRAGSLSAPSSLRRGTARSTACWARRSGSRSTCPG